MLPKLASSPSAAADDVIEYQASLCVCVCVCVCMTCVSKDSSSNFSRASRDGKSAPFVCRPRITPGFQRSVSLAIAVAVAVSVKTVSVQAVYAVSSGACARQ